MADAIQLRVSDDEGATWKETDRVKPTAGQFKFHAPHDGEYWFTVSTIDHQGRVVPKPRPGPELRVVVDTTAPKLEIDVESLPNGKVAANWRIIDANLDLDTLMIQCRSESGDGTWQTVALESPANQQKPRVVHAGQAVWTPPVASGRLLVRATVRDLAGNPAATQSQFALNGSGSSTLAGRGVPPGGATSSSASDPSWDPNSADQRTADRGGAYSGQSPSQDWPADYSSHDPLSGVSHDGDRTSTHVEPTPPTPRQPAWPPRTGQEEPRQEEPRPAHDLGPVADNHWAADPTAEDRSVNDPSNQGSPDAAAPDASNLAEKSVPGNSATTGSAVRYPNPPARAQDPSVAGSSLNAYPETTHQTVIMPREGPSASLAESSTTSRPAGEDAWRSSSADGVNPAEALAGQAVTEQAAAGQSVPDESVTYQAINDETTTGEAATGVAIAGNSTITSVPGGTTAADSPRASDARDYSPEPRARVAQRPSDWIAEHQANDLASQPWKPAREVEAPLTTQSSPVQPPVAQQAALPDIRGGLTAGDLPRDTPLRMIRELEFDLEYSVEVPSYPGPTKVELWGTRDRGRSWRCFGIDEDGRSPMHVRVDRPGLYGFRLTVGGTDAPAGPPQRDAKPEIWVGIDQEAPTGRITRTTQDPQGARKLTISWETEDTRLAERPITLAYATVADGPWTPIAADLENTGQYTWTWIGALPEKIFLRLQIRDEAGNTETVVSPRPTVIEPAPGSSFIRDVRPRAPSNRP
jgi:hypothetical protein